MEGGALPDVGGIADNAVEGSKEVSGQLPLGLSSLSAKDEHIDVSRRNKTDVFPFSSSCGDCNW